MCIFETSPVNERAVVSSDPPLQMVTKGNRNLANGALSGANDGKSLIARGAFIYQAKRGKNHSLDPTGVDGARTRNPRRDRAVL